MMINSVQGSSPVSTANAASKAEDSVANGEDRFLKLLVAQMQNQDPLNPLDNAQVTSQMAQINTVQGIENLNATLASLLGGFNAAQPLQAASLVGHAVLAPGGVLSLNGGEAHAGAALQQSVDSMIVTIKDVSGRTVNTVELGPQKAGTVRFVWDGSTDAGVPAAEGFYDFSVKATAAGKEVPVEALTVAQVASVTPGEKGASVYLNGLGQYTLSQIKEIY